MCQQGSLMDLKMRLFFVSMLSFYAALSSKTAMLWPWHSPEVKWSINEDSCPDTLFLPAHKEPKNTTSQSDTKSIRQNMTLLGWMMDTAVRPNNFVWACIASYVQLMTEHPFLSRWLVRTWVCLSWCVWLVWLCTVERWRMCVTSVQVMNGWMPLVRMQQPSLTQCMWWEIIILVCISIQLGWHAE